MATKRAVEDVAESKASKNKRHKSSARKDATSGQRGAFGDLGDATTAPTGDSDLDCEDDSEALAYLRSVRTQASTIPHVIAAKKAGPSLPPASDGNGEDREGQHVDRSIYEDGVGDFRGFYQDGAYVAYAEDHLDEGEDEDGEYDQSYDEDHEEGEENEGAFEEDGDNDLDVSGSGQGQPRNSSVDEIRDAYFASITARFLLLRNLLHTDPPNSALDALPTTNPIEVGEWRRGVDTLQPWESRLRDTDPLPAQIAAMHKDSIFRLLHLILTRKFLRKRMQLRERTSRWIWALLARLPDKGELDYMEIGWIRELGKRAVLLMVTLAELEVLRQNYDVAASSPDDGDGYQIGADVDDYYDDDDLNSTAAAAAPAALTSEINEGRTEHILDAATSATNDGSCNTPKSTIIEGGQADKVAVHSPSPDDASDIEMQLDSDIEDGEVVVEPLSPPRSDPAADIETAKARLLSQLNSDAIGCGEGVDNDATATSMSDDLLPSAAELEAVGELAAQYAARDFGEDEGEQEEGEYETNEYEEDKADQERYQEPDRDQVNERATLNMILTVAGEFYGQRDLLEFRDPFGGLQFN
ncbi:hypothetical protein F4777DRAFT_526374 [Nemania sp. FL0916]|nr:hypothetical protein F4777DRAFT_526374 [Nemania sp. FL0916]